ncbi:TonB-dependent receptor [Simiduia agarivorans]|uniref:TonB-dependent receptor n=1 Tax=Simiduia agarivorans (strain DSM 21679 / JCM 13881 / BCRC 17597 / SA1) TaxID=1117647 RepID=K4KZC6_SIMAS|nr:TonB-dependent receptor [Simiduia agarivorans]AFU99272.2 TonB-dependent receptor [Simiduia agarivorans SA1 = DSM 21679]
MSVTITGERRSTSEITNETFTRRPLALWVRAAALAGLTAPLAMPVLAQSADAQNAEVLEEITVTGTRKLVQDQIAIKRDATTIVDGLSASDIGELPALSIGEALESITGAASHRENGGATEITIRGLGPFLSATHFNGREATNGSGDRSVNFSQFPSELMSKVAIYKTQDASMIEGGVAGVIALETLKPLEYGKQRIQGDVKLNYNPDQQHIDNSLQGDLGYRGTLSYVDQFEFGDGQAIGISLGGQRQAISQPEGEYRSSSPTGSSLWACLNDPSITNEGFFRSSSGDCEDRNDGSGNNRGYDTTIDPNTGKAVSDGIPYAWTGSSRSYRQNETSDERDSFFVSLQYQPSERWDINFDAQVSNRTQAEERHDLVFEQKRVTPGVTGENLVTNAAGGILHWEGDARFEANGEKYSREENYQGFGLNVSHNVNDRLTIEVDASHSATDREELQISNRAQGDRIPVVWDMGKTIPTIIVENQDLTDHSWFDGAYRARVDRENVRENRMDALRIDFDYAMNAGVITGVKGGLRGSEMTYVQFGGSNGNGSRDEYTSSDSAVVAEIQANCTIDFPSSKFLHRVSDGNLITNVDSNGNVIEEGTGNSYAAFDNQCFANALTAANGVDFVYPEVEFLNPGTTDVTETTYAAYVMADYETQLADRGLRGNFGVRVVSTDVTSNGYRDRYVVVTDPVTGVVSLETVAGEIEKVSGGGDYVEFLPSVNFVWDYSEQHVIRGGVYRGMSRVNPSDMGYSRTFDTDDTSDPTTLPDLLVGANGSGNPDAKPLMSWNADVSFEWYPNDDAIFAAGVYYKRFLGGFEQRTVMEEFVIDGQTVSLPITNAVTTDQESNLYGIEMSAAYRWDNGIGVKAGYNYADSDFEFEDSLYGDTYTTGLDGVRTQLTAGIVDPASVPGLSNHVFNGQIYYQIGDFDTALIYKYRSGYFQPYTSNGTRLRYVGDVGTWEARASYDLTDNVKLKVEAINLFSAPKQQYFFDEDNLGEVNSYGPRIFAGVTVKF